MSYVRQNKDNDSCSTDCGGKSKAAAGQFNDQRDSALVQLQQQRLMAAAPLQRMAMGDEEDELLQGKFVAQRQGLEDEEDILQGKFEPAQRAEKVNDTGMPDQLKAGVESLSGLSIDHVRVHYNSDKPAQLNAHAYAQGSEIHLGPGQEQHLPHEAWHVVQQMEGRVKPTMQMKGGVLVNDDEGLEGEADLMGARALGLGAVQMRNKGDAGMLELTPAQALQDMIDDSPHIVAQRQQQAAWFGAAAHSVASVLTGEKLPIQRALNNQTLAGYARNKGLTGDVARAVLRYNQAIRTKSHKTRIAELNALQTLLFTWFDDNRKGDLDQNPMAKRMKIVINDLQQEHEAVVRLSLVKNDVAPPVAGFDALPKTMQTKVKKVWDDLVNGTGNVIITQDQSYKSKDDGEERTVTHEGFAGQTLAAFARMLESEFGRSLLIRANQDTGEKKTIRIRPGNALGGSDIPSEEFAAIALDAGKGELKEVDTAELFGKKKKNSKAWKKVKKTLSRFPELVIPDNATEEDRISLIHNAPKTYARKAGYRIKDGEKFRYFEFNEGTGSTIVLTNDIRDSSDYMTSRFIDENGNEIIVPVFITLAHELGHALHFLEGNALLTVTETLGGIVAPRESFGEWSNLEEYQTIKGVENRVRKDTGATDRFSHHNFLSHTARQIQSGPLEEAYIAAEALQNPARQKIEDLLREVSTALGGREMKNAQKLLKKAQKLIEEVAQQDLVAQQQQQNGDNTQSAGGGFLNFWPFV